MKKDFSVISMNELCRLIDKVSEYDEAIALSAICTMIDAIARDSDKTAPEIAELICEKVKEVNEVFGAF